VIFGGSAPWAPEHAAVVALHQRSGSSVYVSPFCSGTLITDTVVLTAAHCLDTATGGGGSFRTMAPSALAIYVGNDPAVDLLAHLYTVSETRIVKSYNRRTIRNDIALVRLSRPITEAIAPVPGLPASKGFTEADAGAIVDFVGFGTTEFGTSGVKLHVEVPLAGLGCAASGCSGGDAATQVSYNQGDGGPCFGDSGGPLFLDRDGVVYTAGITSYGDRYCTGYGVSTRVDAFGAFIAEFVGPEAEPEPDPDTGGESGGGSGTCGDGVCDAGESCDGRSGTVACSSDCAGRVSGKPSERFCYVGGTCSGPGCP